MDLKLLIQEVHSISSLIEQEDFEQAYGVSLYCLDLLKDRSIPSDALILLTSNIGGFLVDIGSSQPNQSAAKLGYDILISNKENILKYVSESDYYYNLANAKSNLIRSGEQGELTFEYIEDMLVVKNYYWKSYHALLKEERVKPEVLVNLSNSLKKQFRVTEALNYYDKANKIDGDIPQSWINRSESLILLNDISYLTSTKMLVEVKRGYEKVVMSKNAAPSWKERFLKLYEYFEERIEKENKGKVYDEEMEDRLDNDEYSSLSDYQKFCIEKNLMLSEHSLYCKCIGSSRDNITILTPEVGVIGDFIIPMEMALNRIKAEYSLSRKLYYEFLFDGNSIADEDESCYSELFNNEVLDTRIEKLRTSFRMCFGILDKIAVAINEMFKIPSANKNNEDISFHSFWRLNKDNRRDFFESIKSPGLLALYSIAADLNKHKDGEMSFYKEWRNDLEHKFLVIYRGDKSDLYGSYSYFQNIIFIEEEDFIKHFEQLLNITRSAIFSFVYTIRHEGKKTRPDGIITMGNEIQRKIN